MNKQISTIFCLACVILSACSDAKSEMANSCEPRVYFHQTVRDFEDKDKYAGGAPTNDSINMSHHTDDMGWIVKGYVRLETPLTSAPITSEFEKITGETTFLTIGVDDPVSYKFNSNVYFDNSYENWSDNLNCPIFVGSRNGKFALATIRKRSEKETPDIRKECNAKSTLAFFGLEKDELKNFEDYISEYMEPIVIYDTDNIAQYLSEKCAP